MRKLSKNHNLVFELPTLKLVIDAIELNGEDGDDLYQDQIVKYSLCKKYIYTESRPGNGTGYYLLFSKRYSKLYSNEAEAGVNVNSEQCDCLSFDVCLFSITIFGLNQHPK